MSELTRDSQAASEPQVRSSALLAGATVQLRDKREYWKAFVLVDGMELHGHGHTPAIALAELACRIDNWMHAFDAPANDQAHPTAAGGTGGSQKGL